MEVILKHIAKVTAGNSAPNKEEFSTTGIPFIRAGSLEFLVRGVPIDECEMIDPAIAKVKRLRLFPKGSILFAKSGMSAKMGRIYVLSQDAYVVSHLAVITVSSTDTNNLYIAYYFNYRPPFNLIKDDAYPSISITDIENIEIPLPDLETQNKIVAILDKAKSILDKREETIAKYDELLRAVFLEMFGDPVINPRKWETRSLSEFGTLKNGLNYSSDEVGVEVRCLGVGNFKAYWKISNTNDLPKLSLSKMPSEDYFLNNGDLVFVRSNGNKELVGRCIAVYPENEKVTFSGFSIRYRALSDKINSIYLAHLFRVENFRKSMLQNGRGANIQNINQRILESLSIPYPSIELQDEFEVLVEKIEKMRIRHIDSKTKSQILINALSQLAFRGELEFNTAVDLEVLLENDYNFFEENSNTKSIQLLLERLDKNELNEKKFYEQEIYDKAKDFVFELLKEGKVKQVFDKKTKRVKLTVK